MHNAQIGMDTLKDQSVSLGVEIREAEAVVETSLCTEKQPGGCHFKAYFFTADFQGEKKVT